MQDAVREAWMDKLILTVQMATSLVLTNYSQPQLLRQLSAFKAGGPIWNLVDKTGLDGLTTPLGTLILTVH